MKFVRTLKVKLGEEEKSAIEIILRMLDKMWFVGQGNDMAELWERYGSNENDWICIEETLKNLLNEDR